MATVDEGFATTAKTTLIVAPVCSSMTTAQTNFGTIPLYKFEQTPFLFREVVLPVLCVT